MTKIQNPKRFEHLNFDIASNFDSPRWSFGEAGIRISSLIFYLLILFLPTQLGRHFWPNFSFVSGIRVDYLAPTLYVTDVLILFLFIVWVLSKKKFSIFNFQFLIKSKFKNFNIENSFHPPVGRIKFQIGLLATIILIGILLSKNQAVGLYGFIKLLEFIFLGYYTARNIKRLNFETVLFLFSAGIIFESFLAILQYINQTSIGGIFYFFGERTFNAQTPGIANASVNGELVLRPYATFSHPNVLAGYLIIAMTLVSSKFKVQSSKFNKTTVVVSLVVGTLALFLTLSRIAILIWLITLGIFLFRKFLNHKSYILILLGGLLILGLVTPLGARFTELKLTDESIMQRGELIKDSFSIIKSHPIFGVGLNNFLVELPSVHKQDANVFYLQPVHNIYLLILTQTGIVGLAFFIWFILKTFKNLKIKNSLKISNFKFQILLIVLILGLFDHYFLTLQQGQLLFSFILGLCWAKFPSQKSLH